VGVSRLTSLQGVKVWLSALVGLLVGFCSLLSIISLGGGFYWLLDLTSHFRPQYLVIIAVLMPIVVALKRKRLAILAATALCINGLEILPFYLPQPATIDLVGSRKLKILTLNVNYQNQRFDKILECINKFDPDVFAIEELTPGLDKELKSRLPFYKYGCSVPKTDPFGIGIFSRVPIDGSRVVYFEPKFASIVGELTWDGKPLFLVATHPTTPLTQGLAAENKAQLMAISAEIEQKKETAILIGDLNATSWCSAYKDAVGAAHLIDTSRGFGLQVSWLRSFPPLCLAIDHCLTTPDLVTDARVIGPDIGSDHWPVYVELQRRGPYRPNDLLSRGSPVESPRPKLPARTKQHQPAT
jgi:endonuclease/exonuclease/phosphatase (EEP) superfamily protein YafD